MAIALLAVSVTRLPALLLGRNVRWPRRTLFRGETDGRQAVTLRFQLWMRPA